MPTYSYQCKVCDNIVDIFQSMSDAVLEKTNCIKCKKESKVKRLISGGSGMIFKGSGFYLTDYTVLLWNGELDIIFIVIFFKSNILSDTT